MAIYCQFSYLKIYENCLVSNKFHDIIPNVHFCRLCGMYTMSSTTRDLEALW